LKQDVQVRYFEVWGQLKELYNRDIFALYKVFDDVRFNKA